MDPARRATAAVAPSPATVGRPCLPDAVISEVAALWQDELKAAAPDLTGPASRLLARIMPPSWALEWSLPYWLGIRFGLPRETWLRLVLANVAGLGYVRLQDDLLDGENGAASPHTLSLVGAVHDLWLRVLLELLGDRPVFWDWYERCMADWLTATALDAAPSPNTTAGLRRLADRGAPLKICVAASCELAGCGQQQTRSIAAAVDDLLAAAVLFDHAMDWEEDLQRRRYNAFVASYSNDRRGGEAGADENVRRSIAQDFALGEAAEPYFDLIRSRLGSAERRAFAADLSELARFARWLADTAAEHRATVAVRTQVRLREALGTLQPRGAGTGLSRV